MRPQSLFPIFGDIGALPGIGPRLKELVARVAGPRIVDLLWTLPTGLVDRRHAPKVAEAVIGEIATITVRIDAHEQPGAPKRPYRVICSDETGFLTLVFFHAKQDWLEKTYPVGETRVVSGRVDEFGGGRQMTHPDFAVSAAQADSIRTVHPVYPLTQGLTRTAMKRAIDGALDRAPTQPEWADAALIAQRQWPDWREALQRAHRPESGPDLLPDAPA
ncbi:MAG: ATP-dependent DNA helicase RecG, partial [Rhodospirillaceae bacterium]|nr:ATP-dependent DNA helicase RecG [Rhodospirillaceae bacterium]